MAEDIGDLRDLLESLPAHQQEELIRGLKEMSFKRQKAGEIAPGDEGSPADTLVQKLAARKLKEHRTRDRLSYRQIGELYGVSAERVRRVYERLCPFEFAAERRERRAAG